MVCLKTELLRRGIDAPADSLKADVLTLLGNAAFPSFAPTSSPGADAKNGEYLFDKILPGILNQMSIQQTVLTNVLDNSSVGKKHPNRHEELPFFTGKVDYFGIFERVAWAEGWLQETKIIVLISKLEGRDRAFFLMLSDSETKVFSRLRVILLKRFFCSPKDYRRPFRLIEKSPSETNLEFSYKLYDLLIKRLNPSDGLKLDDSFKYILDQLASKCTRKSRLTLNC